MMQYGFMGIRSLIVPREIGHPTTVLGLAPRSLPQVEQSPNGISSWQLAMAGTADLFVSKMTALMLQRLYTHLSYGRVQRQQTHLLTF
jgi:hypothetical protein